MSCLISMAPYHKQPRRQACYLHGLNGSCSHVMSTESRIGVICKTTNVCTNSSMMLAAIWTLRLETMAVATLNTASQTRASSMAQSTMNLGTQMQDNARPHVICIVPTLLDMDVSCMFTRSLTIRKCLSMPSDWLVTIRQSLQLMSCGIVLKLHGHLYLYMASNL
ncbi:hypothetical protein TNCV_2517981 [Trichonephila clavipes]|nr:hypothetical protein TNCV_2517981 [Trichonephila clavipes]